MKNELIEVLLTGDGSFTLKQKAIGETYHSLSGAISESVFIYIQHGLNCLNTGEYTLEIFEMGFGTGLNALLTLKWAEENKQKINYTTIENNPLDNNIIQCIDYTKKEDLSPFQSKFSQMHQNQWNKEIKYTSYFSMTKIHGDITTQLWDKKELYHCIFFDAFAPSKQANVWEKALLINLYEVLKENGLLITYCAQGNFKRNLIQIGFEIENPPGPMGKREITKAFKQ